MPVVRWVNKAEGNFRHGFTGIDPRRFVLRLSLASRF